MTWRTEMMRLIRQVHMRFVKYFSRRFASGRLSHPQYMLLMILLEEGPQKMNALADFLRISTPAVTNLVDKLERGGHAKRLPHPSDRRAHIVALTDSGRAFIGGLREESLRLLAETIGSLAPSERRVIEKFYRNLLVRLDEALGRQGEANNPKSPACHTPCRRGVAGRQTPRLPYALPARHGGQANPRGRWK